MMIATFGNGETFNDLCARNICAFLFLFCKRHGYSLRVSWVALVGHDAALHLVGTGWVALTTIVQPILDELSYHAFNKI